LLDVGCKKDLTPTAAPFGNIGYRLSADNAALLQTLTAQTSVNSYGMLVFADSSAVRQYQTDLANLENKWEFDSTVTTRFPYYHALEQALGFNSLRKLYEQNEDAHGPDFYLYDKIAYLGSADMQGILNQYHEVAIDGHFLKFMSNHYLAEIANADVNALSRVRQFGLLARHPNLAFRNLDTGETEESPVGPPVGDGPPPTPNDPENTCQAVIVDTKLENRRSRVCIGQLWNINSNGQHTTSDATFSWAIWKNGSFIGNSSYGTATINFPEVTSTTQDYDEYTLILTATATASSTCVGTISTATAIVRIYKAGHDCISYSRSRFGGKVFDYNGSTYNITGEIGQEQWNALVSHRNRMTATTRLYKRNASGNFEPYNPHIFTTERTKVILGTKYYLNNCSTSKDGGDKNNYHSFPWAGEVKESYDPQGSGRENFFGTVGNDTDPAAAFNATFEARMSSFFTQSFTMPISGSY
jgi:hypothetical protein